MQHSAERYLERVLRGVLPPALGLLVLSACAVPPGEPCNTGSQCPINSYCLLSRCVASATLSQNLSILVTPADPSLAPQQFLPRQYSTVDGFSTLLLATSQAIRGVVGLPANCPARAGYPIEFDFTAPSWIPGVPNSFQFFSDASGNVQASLPAGSYAERISTAAACAAPILGNDLVSAGPPGFFPPVFPAPFVDGSDPQSEGAASLDITGTVNITSADAGLYNPTVRILAPAGAGPLAGTAISGDQPLLQDAGLWFGDTFVAGGPAALPVQPLPGGGIIQTLVPTSDIPIKIQNTVCDGLVDGGLGDGGRTVCDQFVVELGPSSTQLELPTIDVQVDAPEIDAGETERRVNAIVQIPFNPAATHPLSILAQGPGSTPQVSVPLASIPLTISTVDGGITACLNPDAGVTCSVNNTTTTDANGAATFHVVPGRYAVTLRPPPPFGQTTTMVDIASNGRIAGSTVGAALDPDGGQVLILPAVAPVPVQGTGHELSAGGPLLPAGEVRLLTLPGMVPAAQQSLSEGAFAMSAPPGRYVLVIEPDASTRFPSYYTDLTVQASTSSPNPSYFVLAPGILAGVVEQAGDGGLPLPVPAYLQFFYVATDGDGDSIAIPVATAVTDSQGRWSAPGPPGE
jgi:hypothetical protein